ASIAGNKASEVVYQKTNNEILATMTGAAVGMLTYGGMSKYDSVKNVSGYYKTSEYQTVLSKVVDKDLAETGIKGGSSSRGVLSEYLGLSEENSNGFFYSLKNANGGDVYVSVNEITAENFESALNSAKGNVNILSGVHGDSMGNIIVDKELYFYDITHYSSETVNVIDFNSMSFNEISGVVNSSDTTICSWCYSEMNPAIRMALMKGE
ncbi:hypothetical protein, partial [Lachnotalea glycerini]